MYERLAAFLVENLDFDNVSTILEAGCGSGLLTLPFARKIMQRQRMENRQAYFFFLPHNQ